MHSAVTKTAKVGKSEFVAAFVGSMVEDTLARAHKPSYCLQHRYTQGPLSLRRRNDDAQLVCTSAVCSTPNYVWRCEATNLPFSLFKCKFTIEPNRLDYKEQTFRLFRLLTSTNW